MQTMEAAFSKQPVADKLTKSHHKTRKIEKKKRTQSVFACSWRSSRYLLSRRVNNLNLSVLTWRLICGPRKHVGLLPMRTGLR